MYRLTHIHRSWLRRAAGNVNLRGSRRTICILARSTSPLLLSSAQYKNRRSSEFAKVSDLTTSSLRFLSSSTATRAERNSRLVDYLLADVGEGITECEIVKWFVEPGSTVEEFDVLVEVQSDKASVEITSRYAGIVDEHCYKVGEVAKVGSALCKIRLKDVEEAANNEKVVGEDEGGNEKEQRSSVTQSQATEGTKANSSDKDISVDDTSSSSSSSTSSPITSEGKRGTLATPAVRRIIREHGVDIDKVIGTGKSGRVTKEDVNEYMSSSNSTVSSSSSLASSDTGGSGINQGEEEQKVMTLSGTRKAMYKAMTTTWNIPHFGYSDDVDVTKLDQVRKEMQLLEGGKIKLTMLPLLVKAMSLAMYDHPIFRSTLDVSTLSLREKEQHRISIALSSPRGLLTPTLQSDIRKASVVEIAKQIHSLQQISQERGLNQKEMGSGATVTLSNIGNIGGLYTFPLIPPTGQLIIGAIGRSRLLPRFDDKGDIIKALVLPVSFSADHRVVEGVELAKFVQDWKRLIENPSSWLLKMR